MEVVALFVWPAVAFAVIGALAYSWLPKKTKAQKDIEVAEQVLLRRQEFAELELRMLSLERTLKETGRGPAPRVIVRTQLGHRGRGSALAARVIHTP
jgi:hypothetical protein